MSPLLLDAHGVLEDLRSFVGCEFEAQRRAFADQIALPVNERVERGTCVTGLNFAQVDAQGLAVFRHEGNDSKLREGDAVRLSQGQPGNGREAAIYREEKNELWLVAEKPFDPAIFEGNSAGWMIDAAFIDLEYMYLEALDRLPGSAIGQERILPLLMGEAETALDEEEYGAVYAELADAPQAWEDAQREAIAGCLAAEHCYLVQGPPGTGKTRVLAQVVHQLVERGERVLITGFTHRAINNALSATAHELGDRQRVARICAPVHRRDENFDCFESFRESPLSGLSGGWVAAATPFALRKRLRAVEFDVIVVDEAGQMTTALAVIAMLAGRKYLFFGDQQQLGPVAVSRSRREARYIGIFHALRSQDLLGTRLDVTYRLNEDLAQWPSEHFYKGELKPSPSAAQRRLNWSATPQMEPWLAAALDPAAPLVWIRLDHQKCRTFSQSEVNVASQLMRALCQGGVKPEDTAIVTPFRRQARQLRKRLETLMPLVSWRGCVIDTVERMQGQEREVIVLSLCASEPSFIESRIDFLFDPRRLNVSVTRARTKLIILASDALLEVNPFDSDFEEDIALLRSLKQCATLVTAPPGP